MRCICHSWRFDLQRMRLRRSSSCDPANIASAKEGVSSNQGEPQNSLRNDRGHGLVVVFLITERVACSGLPSFVASGVDG